MTAQPDNTINIGSEENPVWVSKDAAPFTPSSGGYVDIPTIDSEVRNALEHIWGGGIDYATSPDFQDLTVDEKDALYIRYRDNLIDRATHTIKNKIAQEANKAVLRELTLANTELYKELGPNGSSYLRDRIVQLTADKEEDLV